jgi:hypothetical protein
MRLPPRDDNFQAHPPHDLITSVLDTHGPKRRIHTLFPYLLVRAVPRDYGGRPLWPPTPFWESCDIHLMPAGADKFDFARTVLNPTVGDTYSVWVHVWNLGRAPSIAVRVRAWWVEPGFFATPGDPRYPLHEIGAAYVDLNDRDSGRGAHQMVQLKPEWTVVGNQEAHECLLVAVESTTDPWAPTPTGELALDANAHRHAAQRNLTLVTDENTLDAPIHAVTAGATDRAQQLVVAGAQVDSGRLAGAQRADTSSRSRVVGWTHSTLSYGQSSSPLLAVRWENGTTISYDLDARRGIPAANEPLREGVPFVDEIEHALPDLLRTRLGIPDLTATEVARAVTGRSGRAGLLRLILSESDGAVGGYSIIAAPAPGRLGRTGGRLGPR